MTGFGAPVLPRPSSPIPSSRVKFGDHVGYRGIYTGLIVDITQSNINCTVAIRHPETKKISESSFATNTLHAMEPRA